MKEKILFLLNKLKSIKKRVWVILSLILVGLIYWISLSYQERIEIRASLGDREAKKELAWKGIMHYCDADEVLEWDVKWRASKLIELKDIQYIDYLLRFSDSKISCSDYKRRMEIQKGIDQAIIRKYSNDYDQLDKYVLEKISYSRIYYLFPFYYRNRMFDRISILIYQIRDLWYGDRSEQEKLGFMVTSLNNINALYSTYSIKGILERLIEITTGEKNQYYKYLFAKFLLETNLDDSKGLSIINDLAEQNYMEALLFLADQYMYDSQPELAKQYIVKAEKSSYGNYDVSLAWYKFYNRYPELYKELSIFDYSDSTRLTYLERAGLDIKDRVADPEYRYDVLQFADLSLQEKRNYDKVKKVYEIVLQSRARGKDAWNYWDYKVAYTGLGDIFYQGLGLRQDLKKAWEYYGKACDLKYQEACDKFREVNEKIR